MAKITATNAHRMALWLATHEPTLFNELARQAQAAHPIGPLGALGSSDGLSPITITATTESMPSVSSGSSGGFWSSLSSDITSGVSDLGSGLSNAVSNVGGFLTSKQGLSSLTSLAGLYLQGKAVATQANVANQQLALQRQALATQTGLFTSGQSPAPISYTTNPLTGQLQPTYYTGTSPTNLYGQAISSQQLSSLMPSTISQYLPYILIGGGLLAAIAFLG